MVQAYPRFALADPAVTKSILIKHLVCACTGMPRSGGYRSGSAAKAPAFAGARVVQVSAGEHIQPIG